MNNQAVELTYNIWFRYKTIVVLQIVNGKKEKTVSKLISEVSNTN